MNFSTVSTIARNAATKGKHVLAAAKFKIVKAKPELLLAAGVGLGVACVVAACKETLQVEEVVDNTKKRLDDIHETEEKVKEGQIVPQDYTPVDAARDKAIVYAKAGKDPIKVYWPSILLGTASVACVLTSHGIMRSRNLKLIASYTALDEAHRQYRERVIGAIGEEAEKKLYSGEKYEKVEVKFKDENGETTYSDATEGPVYNAINSPYTRLFDEMNPRWEDDPTLNKFFLVQTENYCNQRLVAKGHLFLNEVLEELGFPHTSNGAITGWIYDKDKDKRVSFGLDRGFYDPEAEGQVVRDFHNGFNPSIMLMFNVDGVIYDKI